MVTSVRTSPAAILYQISFHDAMSAFESGPTPPFWKAFLSAKSITLVLLVCCHGEFIRQFAHHLYPELVVRVQLQIFWTYCGVPTDHKCLFGYGRWEVDDCLLPVPFLKTFSHFCWKPFWWKVKYLLHTNNIRKHVWQGCCKSLNYKVRFGLRCTSPNIVVALTLEGVRSFSTNK